MRPDLYLETVDISKSVLFSTQITARGAWCRVTTRDLQMREWAHSTTVCSKIDDVNINVEDIRYYLLCKFVRRCKIPKSFLIKCLLVSYKYYEISWWFSWYLCFADISTKIFKLTSLTYIRADADFRFSKPYMKPLCWQATNGLVVNRVTKLTTTRVIHKNQVYGESIIWTASLL